MPIAVANGPVSWGVYYGDDPTNFPWEAYLDEVAAVGFAWTELGPVGYLPEDPERLRDELGKRNLGLVAGFIFDSLHDPAERQRLQTLARRTCTVLASQGARHFVIIDNLPEERARTAGRSDAAPRLDKERWQAFMTTIAGLAIVARDEFGLEPVVHPHVGGYLEFSDEIEAALHDLPDDLVGLCLDTGHTAYAGVDPIALFERHADRVRYLHFKNIDAGNHRRAITRKLDLFAAITEGVFCPLAEGTVDFEKLRLVLETHGYRGFATVEQDSDPRAGAQPKRDAATSLEFLRRIGLADGGGPEQG